jgi:hypothetical protein
MQFPSYVCTHITVQDHHRRYATINKFLAIAKNKSLLKQGHRNTIDHVKMIDCNTHYVCQEITVERCWSGAMDVDEEVQPKVEMACKIHVLAPVWRGGGTGDKEAMHYPLYLKAQKFPIFSTHECNAISSLFVASKPRMLQP